ncbi:MAG: hypothetical protein HY658_00275 [Actinobacteria bacterium]|nr:hypothetical protein [Actinomycetota bacterium]
MLRFSRMLVLSSVAAVALAACDGAPPDGSTTGPPATTTRASPTGGGETTPSPAGDEEVLTALAIGVAAEQRPDEGAIVTEVSFFDDPEGCESGEAALVTVEFPSEPAEGIILFCRAGETWQVNQGILYGE